MCFSVAAILLLFKVLTLLAFNSPFLKSDPVWNLCNMVKCSLGDKLSSYLILFDVSAQSDRG